jgi:hypothetical protein
MKIKQIKLSEIVIDAGTQQREAINTGIVSEYAEAIKCGAKFPPVVVFSDGVNYYLVDGFHRRHAYAALEIPAIDAEVHDGTVRDAILFSASVNKTHGIRPTNADKRKSVLMLLSDQEWSEWSDRKIAKHCNVSDVFVGKLRKIQGANVCTLPPKPALNRDDDQKLSTDKKLSTGTVRRIGHHGTTQVKPAMNYQSWRGRVNHQYDYTLGFHPDSSHAAAYIAPWRLLDFFAGSICQWRLKSPCAFF